MIKFVIPAFLIVCVSVCGDNDAGAQQSASNEFHLAGPITDRSVDVAIMQLERSNATTLRISSGGGQERAAVDLALYIEENEIDVVIDTVCAGACFTIVALSANEIYVEEDAFYSFVVSTYAMYNHISEFREIIESDSSLRYIVSHAPRIYERRGINPQIFADSVHIANIDIDYALAPDRQGNMRAEVLNWVPTPEYLLAAGAPIRGDLIRSAEEAAERYEPFAPSDNSALPDLYESIVYYGDVLLGDVRR